MIGELSLAYEELYYCESVFISRKRSPRRDTHTTKHCPCMHAHRAQGTRVRGGHVECSSFESITQHQRGWSSSVEHWNR